MPPRYLHCAHYTFPEKATPPEDLKEPPVDAKGRWTNERFIEWDIEIWELIQKDGSIKVQYKSHKIIKMGCTDGWSLSNKDYGSLMMFFKNQRRTKAPKTAIRRLKYIGLKLCKRINIEDRPDLKDARMCLIDGCNRPFDNGQKHRRHAEKEHAQRIKEEKAKLYK